MNHFQPTRLAPCQPRRLNGLFMEKKVIVVMPAYNAELTLEKSCRDIPEGAVDEVILCDDHSRDKTVEIAKNLGLTVVVHDRNRGYGANQKTCFAIAPKDAADVIVLLHPDYQYDSRKIPKLIQPILDGKRDVMLGSRISGGGTLKGGMPLYKYIANKLLTFFENLVLGLGLSEYHTGLRAYSRRFLEKVDFRNFSDDFLFDAQILMQAARFKFRVGEIPIETRYFKEASQVGFLAGIKYGIGTLWELVKFIMSVRPVEPVMSVERAKRTKRAKRT